ncbi:VanZ family protein [Litchfieldia salsa]|uniref:VanZ like family protein n=1 Tax=Litchfieldia salsa TaxID=930152 RepID=A0A1H0W2X5_9BACI|nr:VanZ family protein [Litchfieldia salsa]SDP85072.1 VanZ like family protein [Litchfieldia salsa]
MNKKRIIWWVITIGYCYMIFHATGSPSFTGDSTSSMLGDSIKTVYDFLGISWDPYLLVDQLNFIIRKSGHVIAFGLLGILFRFALGDIKRAYLYAWILTTVYAMTDEFHQSLVPSRTASIMDVGLDSIGAGLALLALWIFNKRKGKL